MLVAVAHRRLIAIAGTLAIATIAGLPAGADAAVLRTSSTNWAGYAASSPGARFRTASGTWVQPAASCSPGTPADVAIWVGIGGFHSTSHALDQIGTEVDCNAAGKARYSAWYELVPAASVHIPLAVRPGDRMAARVSVRGHRVTLRLRNVTTNATVTRVRRASKVDRRSAEWIVEAPTVCDGSGCNISELADFGTTGFSSSRARTTDGHTGAIADPAWSPTAIDLAPGAPGLGTARNWGVSLTGSATTGDLSPAGGDFSVTYQSPATTVPGLPSGAPVTSGVGAP
jgi:hypothetical protein